MVGNQHGKISLMKKKYFMFILITSLFYSGCESNIYTDEITRISYPGASDLRDGRPLEDVVSKKSTPYSRLEYQVEIKYPAESMISFYQEKFEALGYEPVGVSKWESERDVVFKGNASQCSFRFNKAWANKEKTRVAEITIRYYSPLHYYDGMHGECPFEPDTLTVYVNVDSYPYNNWKATDKSGSQSPVSQK